MGDYSRSILIQAPVERVFHFHDDSANLIAISPPDLHVKIIEVRGPVGVGHQVRLQTKQFGLIGQELLIEFVVYDPPHQLVDVQLKGPFKSWQQTRIFQSTPEGTLLTDSVSYSLPFGLLGQVADSLLVARQVEQMFSWRQARTKQLLEHGGE